MNATERDVIERELNRLKPAQPPGALMDRMLAGVVEITTAPYHRPSPRGPTIGWWLPLLRWLTPASAAVLVAIVSLRSVPLINRASAAGFNADAVQLSQELVSDFEAVGELPSGEPVRFLCREWKDTAVFQDSRRGLVIEQSIPRLEVIPIGFETY